MSKIFKEAKMKFIQSLLYWSGNSKPKEWESIQGELEKEK